MAAAAVVEQGFLLRLEVEAVDVTLQIAGFFGNDDGYTNIDKGRPSRNNMSNGFRDVLPLLDAYVAKLDKKE